MMVSLSTELNTCRTSGSPAARADVTSAASTIAACRSINAA